MQEIIRFDTEFLAAADANQSSAAIYQLCAKSLSPQWSAFEFDTCFGSCTATSCPQPAWKFMHHPRADPILAVICGNYTGTKPKGCPARGSE